MNTNFTNVDAVSTINYQFTAIPTNFIYLMDNDCFKLFSILLQKETYWKNKGMLKDGYFIKSISELSEELNLKNRKDVHTIIEALYRKKLIAVITQPRKHNTAKFKLNWNKINEYLDKSIYDLMEFEERIVKLNRNEIITYTNNVTDNVTNYVTNNDTKCNTTKDNINKIDNKENINNIYNNINKENNNNINIYRENSEEIGLMENPISENDKEENNLKNEEVGFVDNPTSINEIEDTEHTPMGNGTNDEDEALDMIFGKEEKIDENNTAFQPIEVGMQIIEEKETPSMKEKFEKNLNLLLNRLNDSKSLTDLENKVVKLCDWIERCESSYTPSELESIKEKVSSTYVSIHNRMFEEIEELERQSMEDIENDFFNNIECNPHTAKTIVQIKKEEKEQLLPNVRIASTKEQLIADLEEYKNTIMNQEDLQEAKGRFKQYINSKDKLIREYEIIPIVADIIKEIDTQIEANKMFLTTFNIKDKESIISDEKTQEIASCEATKGIVGYRVDETEDYPF